jgi:hypothetical protein
MWAVANGVEIWLPRDKKDGRQPLSHVRQEFLNAETGPPKSPPETTDARRDQRERKPVAEIPAQTAYT